MAFVYAFILLSSELTADPRLAISNCSLDIRVYNAEAFYRKIETRL